MILYDAWELDANRTRNARKDRSDPYDPQIVRPGAIPIETSCYTPSTILRSRVTPPSSALSAA